MVLNNNPLVENMTTDIKAELPYLDDCIDGEPIQPLYQVRGSPVLFEIDLSCRDLRLKTELGSYLAGPSFALRAEVSGMPMTADTCRLMCAWIRKNIRGD